MDSTSTNKDNSTSQPVSPAIVYAQARQHAARRRGFYVHCLAYVLGNTTNIIVNWITRQSGGNWWFQWPLIAWTVALGVHAITVASRGAWLGPAWEERKVRNYLGPDEPTSPR